MNKYIYGMTFASCNDLLKFIMRLHQRPRDVPHIPSMAVLFRPRSTWMAMADAAVALLKRLGAGDASIVAQEPVSWRNFQCQTFEIDLMFDV